jgi:hypothetical protein
MGCLEKPGQTSGPLKNENMYTEPLVQTCDTRSGTPLTLLKNSPSPTQKNIATENQPTLPESDRDTATGTTDTTNTGGLNVFILHKFKLRHAAGCDEDVTSEDYTRKTTLVVQFDIAPLQIGC